jgi:beta-xylosidase
MYYTGRDVQAGRQCVSTAVATAPEGPFVDDSETPLVCQLDLGGSIDPYPFVAADGARYLLWKNDGNCCSLPTRLWMQPLTDDGLGLTGSPIDLGLRNDVPWEGAVIEAPTLVQHDDRYYLFYSANAYDSERYAMGYAVSDRLEGPYEDARENPILTSHGGAAGPGGQAVTTDLAGEEWLLYHAWDAAAIGDSVGGRRAMWLDELRFVDDRPIVDGPDSDPQPVPIAD